MVSHPETGSDSPIGSDRDWGRDILRKMPIEKSIIYINTTRKKSINVMFKVSRKSNNDASL